MRRKVPRLMRLMDALLTDHYRTKLPENLERFERYGMVQNTKEIWISPRV